MFDTCYARLPVALKPHRSSLSRCFFLAQFLLPALFHLWEISRACEYRETLLPERWRNEHTGCIIGVLLAYGKLGKSATQRTRRARRPGPPQRRSQILFAMRWYSRVTRVSRLLFLLVCGEFSVTGSTGDMSRGCTAPTFAAQDHNLEVRVLWHLPVLLGLMRASELQSLEHVMPSRFAFWLWCFCSLCDASSCQALSSRTK